VKLTLASSIQSVEKTLPEGRKCEAFVMARLATSLLASDRRDTVTASLDVDG